MARIFDAFLSRMKVLGVVFVFRAAAFELGLHTPSEWKPHARLGGFLLLHDARVRLEILFQEIRSVLTGQRRPFFGGEPI